MPTGPGLGLQEPDFGPHGLAHTSQGLAQAAQGLAWTSLGLAWNSLGLYKAFLGQVLASQGLHGHG